LAAALEDLVADQPQHPAITAALAAGVEGTSAYFAQDYANGDALDASLRQHGPPPLESVIVTLSRLAEALDRAAGEGIHHGALHPRDLLVSGGGEVRLIDLGVAQALQRAGLRTPLRRPYSAPERVEGRAWGGPADIFALGAIVFEMVTGKRIAGPGAPVVSADGVSGLDSDALADVLGRALHADPGSRFASASDLEDELRPILARGRRAVLAVKRPRSRPEGVMPLPLDLEPPVLEAFDPEVTLTPTIASAPVDLPLAHGTGTSSDAADRFRDVLAESGSASFTPEESSTPEPEPGPVVVPPRTVSVPMAPSAAASAEPPVVPPPAAPEPAVPAVRTPPVAHDPEGETERRMERASFSAWSSQPPEPDRRSLVIPLSFAMLLGLAGGFGLGYWTGWRSALRDSSTSVASAPAGRPEAAPPSAVSSPREAAGGASTGEPTTPSSAHSAPPTSAAAAQPAAKAPAPAAPREARAPRREAPAAPRSAASGRLLVKSTPSGAQVRVDGRARGKTPLILRDLPLKVVRVRVEHRGYHAVEERVALTAAKPTVTVDAKLTPVAPPAPVTTSGSLVIESRPTGARAFLDGKELGATPVSVPEVAPGQHRVRIEMAGFSPWVTMAEIKAGVRSRVAASLEQGQSQ
jgi:eukaryotic-like serine/threonine-protein kinase